MASDGVAQFLRRLMLRSPLSAEEQRAVLQLSGQLCVLDSHQDIVTPGQTVDHACLIVKGLGGRFDLDADGRRQFTAFHLPGEMCDLHSVPSPHTGWGITLQSKVTECIRCLGVRNALIVMPSAQARS